MAKTLMMEPEFWSDGSVWIAQRDHCDESAGLAEFALRELKVNDWCFFQTSGSTGRRQWVGLTKEALLISARAVNAHFDITARDHWLLALPMDHVGGFAVLARSFVSSSKVTRLEGAWDAALFVRRCEEVEATLASLVPTQVFDLVTAKLGAPKSMRVVWVGGGAMSRELEAAALKLGWPVCRTYGMTETASQVAAQTMDGYGEMEVLPIWEVSTDDDGVLTVRGEALAKGYAIQEAGKWRWETIDPTTGLRTRDRVCLWQHGTRRFLQFVGREANTVKILGELVALGPIQERIETLRLELGIHEGDAVACDVPDARSEARLILVVSQMATGAAATLMERLNQALRPFERLSEIRPVDAIPRSDLGKVLLADLRAML